MKHHLQARLVVAVCQGEVDYSDQLTEDAVDRLSQATKLLRPMFNRWEKRIICSAVTAALATSEVLEAAFKKEPHVYGDLFAHVGHDSMLTDVDNVNFRIDPAKVNFVVVPKDVFREFVETYAVRKYRRLLELKGEPNGGDVAIFDDMEETLQEVHFSLETNTGS